jgi:hypothetical protein
MKPVGADNLACENMVQIVNNSLLVTEQSLKTFEVIA